MEDAMLKGYVTNIRVLYGVWQVEG